MSPITATLLTLSLSHSSPSLALGPFIPLARMGGMLTTAARRSGDASAGCAPDGTGGVLWHTLEGRELVLARAASSGTQGLSEEEVTARLQRYGPNVMTQGAKRTLLGRVWDQVRALSCASVACAPAHGPRQRSCSPQGSRS